MRGGQVAVIPLVATGAATVFIGQATVFLPGQVSPTASWAADGDEWGYSRPVTNCRVAGWSTRAIVTDLIVHRVGGQDVVVLSACGPILNW